MAVAALSACDKVALLAPTGSTVTLNINKTSLPIGGTADVVAVVVEAAGTAPQNGTIVTFSSSFGTMTPLEAPTAGGIARAVFTATGSGTAKIGAFSGAAKATEVELKVGAAAVSAVSVRTEPATIPQSGGTVTVVATLLDASGGVLPSTLVNFLVDNGNLSASAAPTDANGEARVTLTTNRTTKVNANAGSVKATEFTLTALANPTISIGTCTASPAVGVAVNCTITPAATPTTALSNVAVNWGDNTGEQSLGPITGATVASHTFSSPGTYSVTATAIDQNGQRGTATIALVVTRVLPTITIAGATTGSVGVPIAYTITPATTPPLPIANVTVDFGDGSSRNLGAINGVTSITHTFGAEGGYTITATVTDSSGQQGRSAVATVISRAAAPTIVFTNTTTNGPPLTTGVNESFTVTATPAAGAPTISNIRVTLQDGTLLYNGASPGSFSWTPGSAGTATFTIVVTDAAGVTTTIVQSMTVL